MVAGLAAIILTNEHILLKSLHTLAHLNWWWVLAALAAEAISLTAFGISRVILLRAEGDQATLGTVMSITYAGNALSMAVPFAGAQLAAVFSYRQLRGRGLGPAITSWALAVSAIVSSAALALVLLAGAFLGGQPAATLAGLLGAAVFLVPGVTVLLALRYQAARAWIHRAPAVLLRPLHRRWGKSWMDPAALEEFLDRVASISLPGIPARQRDFPRIRRFPHHARLGSQMTGSTPPSEQDTRRMTVLLLPHLPPSRKSRRGLCAKELMRAVPVSHPAEVISPGLRRCSPIPGRWRSPCRRTGIPASSRKSSPNSSAGSPESMRW